MAKRTKKWIYDSRETGLYFKQHHKKMEKEIANSVWWEWDNLDKIIESREDDIIKEVKRICS
jgi:hypothetical protein